MNAVGNPTQSPSGTQYTPSRGLCNPICTQSFQEKGTGSAEMSPTFLGAQTLFSIQDHPTNSHGPWQTTESPGASQRPGVENSDTPKSGCNINGGGGREARSVEAATAPFYQCSCGTQGLGF